MKTQELEIGIKELERFITALELSQAEIQKAVIKAINKTLKQVSTLSARTVAKNTDIQARVIQKRMKTFLIKKTFTALFQC